MSKEFVVDAAVVVSALTGKNAAGIASYKLITESVCHAPHLVDAEVGHVLRRIVRHEQLSAETAQTGLRSAKILIDHRYAHTGWMATAAWELRHTVSFYDALYAALAARLDIPLLTGDQRLSKAPGLPCRVEVIA